MDKPRFAIKTLGCKVNQYEEQVLRENLARLGFQESDCQTADIGIINSCTVTGKADVKTRKLIRKIKNENPAIKIFVTGCYAVFTEDIKSLEEMPEVCRVVPNKEKMELPFIVNATYGKDKERKIVKEEVSGFESHTRAFLKIQDGCDQKCTYCKVNLVRGPSRSKDKKDVTKELIGLTKAGYKEIVLTGICLGAWRGKEGETLSDLLKEIDRVKGDFRIRLSSIEPNYIDDSLIETIACSKRICRHFHVPLQSGSDKILKLMNRRYTRAQFLELINSLRTSMPFIGITMDVIAGFPGESDEDFRETADFLKEVKPTRMHAFGYSDRKGALSNKLKDKVPAEKIKTRGSELIEIGKIFQEEFSRGFIGKGIEVLVEEKSRENSLAGYTGEYVRVKLRGFSGSEGSLIKAKATDIDRNSHCLLVENRKLEGIKA